MRIRIQTRLRSSRLEYVVSYLNAHPIIRKADLNFTLDVNEDSELMIDYGKVSGGDYQVPAQDIYFADVTKMPHHEFVANSYEHEDVMLYSVEKAKKDKSEFITDHRFGFDVFEMIFFHVSRIEEFQVSKDLQNDRGQYKEEQLFAVRHSIEAVPIVDQLIMALCNIFKGQEIDFISQYRMSHDIDYIRKFRSKTSIVRKFVGEVLKIGKPGETLRQYKKAMSASLEDPYNVFDLLLLKQNSIEKHIYFLMGGKHKLDNEYSLDDPIYQACISLAKERNYQIGVHPSYESWDKLDLIKKEKERLESSITSTTSTSRQHYLHFDIEQSPSLLLQAGIKEDASLGYTQRIGFRCGTGFPYQLYDFQNEEASELKECPLVFMDSAAIAQSKREQVDIEILLNSFLMVNRSGTYISFNFHNSRFDPASEYGEYLMKIYLNLEQEYLS